MTLDEALEIADSWTPREKAGQLFMLAFPGKDPAAALPLIRERNLCGCYLSQDNADTFAEARFLCAALDAAAAERLDAPLLLGVDQEGAWGVLVPESTTGPGNMALGAAPAARTEEMYGTFGRQMLRAGFTCLLGPCADVNVDPESPIIGTRSFGQFPDRVAERTRAAVRGARRAGIAATLKHFPGHGGTKGDTHRELPRVDKDLETLRREDFLPFAEGVREGADIVMTSHIRYPAIDPENPATMSRALLTDLLRGEMGFRGVVLSDSMNMGAIRRNYEGGEAAVRALEAGVDVVMLSEEHYDHSAGYLERQLACVDAVEAAIASGRLSARAVREKLERVVGLRVSLRGAARRARAETQVVLPAEAAAAEAAAAAALASIRRDGAIWPFAPGERVAAVNATPRAAYERLTNARGIGPNQAEAAFDAFAAEARKAGAGWRFLGFEDCVGSGGTPAPAALEAAFRGFDKILVVTEDHPLPGEDFPWESQAAFVRAALGAAADRVLLVGLRSPYELFRYPGARAYLCAFSGRPCSARAAARAVLSGTAGPGINPVAVE